MQTFTAPVSGNYKLEVWGALGGGWGGHANAPGGYSVGWRNISKNQILYIVCGGKGVDNSNYADGTSYNGGGINVSGIPWVNGAGGGGATHIATATGLLKDLVDNKEAVICVAGGSGANGGYADEDNARWRCGGGLVGLGSNPIYHIDHGDYTESATTKADTGGTQTGCGPDGIQGGFGYGGNSLGNGGAGGGGWYGGNGSGGGGVVDATHGGGGSGYIGGLTNGSTMAGNQIIPMPGGGSEMGHWGHGYAIISWISSSL